MTGKFHPGDFAWWLGPRGVWRPVVIKNLVYRYRNGRQALVLDQVDLVRRDVMRSRLRLITDDDDARAWHAAVEKAEKRRAEEQLLAQLASDLTRSAVPIADLLEELARAVTVEQFQAARLAVLRVAYRRQARDTLGPDAGPALRVPDFLRSPGSVASVTRTGEKK